MLHFVDGDMFSYQVDAMINTVNCIGVMGAGIAKQFKKKYPKMFLEYQELCSEQRIQPGILHTYQTEGLLIINLPTKTHPRLPSKYEYVEQGLLSLKDFLIKHPELRSITLPALGCGLGGLRWERVSAMITEYLGELPIDIYVFQPHNSR